MEIKGPNYRVWVDSTQTVVSMEGVLQLGGAASYGPIEHLLAPFLAAPPPVITLDVRALSVLDTSGISVLYNFAVSLRNKGPIALVVRGTHLYAWQGTSLPNMAKFNPHVQVSLAD